MPSLQMFELGKQYLPDDEYRKHARLHQSMFRKNELQVDFNEYGNVLTETDAKSLLNYYDSLGVRKHLKRRYPQYSSLRDANLLRSEHIPFNMFGPLIERKDIAKSIISKAFNLKIKEIIKIEIEYAPCPKELYLNDGTSFDVYVEYIDESLNRNGLGIEVKYTEHEYKIGKRELTTITDRNSIYWKLTNNSNHFIESTIEELATDKMRQIWRNHMLGLAMVKRNEIVKFHTITIYPSGNSHFIKAMSRYSDLLKEEHKQTAFGCTFEQFIDSISGDEEIIKWKEYLNNRYIVKTTKT